MAFDEIGPSNDIGFAYLDAGGLLTGPDFVGQGSPGKYRDLQVLPVPGVLGADILTVFENDDVVELRMFSTTESGGLSPVDRDADTMDDVAELRIVDADTGDLLKTIDDVLAGDDFDIDGFSNLAEMMAGTDPIDPLSYPGQVVDVRVALDEAMELGSQSGLIYIERAGETAAALTVGYTVGGTATAGADYTILAGTVTFGPGQLAVPVSVTALVDTLAEGDETVTVSLSAGAGFTIGVPAGTVTIKDLPLDAWRFIKFTTADLLDDAISGITADAEDDGLNTLLEFAFDSEPKVGDLTDEPILAIVEHPSTLKNHLALVYLRRKDSTELLYKIDLSDALDTWVEATDADVEEISVVDNLDGTETVVVRSVEELSLKERRFMRVRVVRLAG